MKIFKECIIVFTKENFEIFECISFVDFKENMPYSYPLDSSKVLCLANSS
jgi:hypothetical protein